MNFTSESKFEHLKDRLFFTGTLLVVYIILFEYILPVNRILPKPSIVVETIPALFSDYDFLKAMAITTSVIYLAVILGYLLIHYFAPYIISLMKNISGALNVLRIFRFIPAFFYAVLFVFWFPGSLFAEFFFALFAALFFLFVTLHKSIEKVGEEYLYVSQSLGITGNKLYKNVIWKHCQPEVFESLKQLHYYLWVLVLVYEFIGGTDGFGGIFNAALDYKDLSALFILAIFTGLLIWLGNFIITYFEKRIIYWEI